MAEHHDEPKESLMEKLSEKIHAHDSSSSDSDNEKEKEKTTSSTSSLKSKVNRLFGREKPVHKVLGGGKRMRSLHFPFVLPLQLHCFFSVFF